MTSCQPATLILGTTRLVGRAADEAMQQSHRVCLRSTENAADVAEPHPLRLDDYSDFVNVFQGAINSLGGIDNLILAFTPPAISHDSDYIPGTDHTAIDDVMMPLMKCVKLGFYHWRRDQRVGAAKKRLVILVQEGHDADTMTSRNAVLGLWRSITRRAEILGVQPELVISDLRDQSNNDAIISTLLASTVGGPTIHVISNGQVASQEQWIGQCQSAPITALKGRLEPLIWLDEKITMMGITFKRLVHPSKPNLTSTTLRLLPLVFMTALAAVTYRAEMPIIAFVCSLVASRISSVGGAVLLALIAFQASIGCS